MLNSLEALNQSMRVMHVRTEGQTIQLRALTYSTRILSTLLSETNIHLREIGVRIGTEWSDEARNSLSSLQGSAKNLGDQMKTQHVVSSLVSKAAGKMQEAGSAAGGAGGKMQAFQKVMKDDVLMGLQKGFLAPLKQIPQRIGLEMSRVYMEPLEPYLKVIKKLMDVFKPFGDFVEMTLTPVFVELGKWAAAVANFFFGEDRGPVWTNPNLPGPNETSITNLPLPGMDPIAPYLPGLDPGPTTSGVTINVRGSVITERDIKTIIQKGAML